MEQKLYVQDNPFLGVTLTPNLTPKWGYFYSLHGLFLLFLELI